MDGGKQHQELTMANRMAPYFLDNDDAPPRSKVINYRSPEVRMNQGDQLIGKLVVVAVFLVPAILFTVIVFYVRMVR